MTKHLDPRFAKVFALMESTTHDGERANARKSAEAIAKACGMTFEQAKAQMNKPAPAPNIFEGIEDFMERQEPGWKAKRNAEHAERRARNALKRAAVIAKYGSADAALAPCGREKLILAAVQQWRKPQKAPYDRWTDNLDGWSDHGVFRYRMPAHVLEAIRVAYPLPKTFGEAKAEHDHWEIRDEEIDLILDETGLGRGDTSLDIAAGVRAEEVREMVEHELPTTTLADLHTRFSLYRDRASQDDKVEAALFRDLESLVSAQHPSSPSTHHPVGKPRDFAPQFAAPNMADPSTLDRDGQIRAMLDADPQQSDRTIARACSCQPTTVGKIRRQMGLQNHARSVHRRGQIYQMHFDWEMRQ